MKNEFADQLKFTLQHHHVLSSKNAELGTEYNYLKHGQLQALLQCCENDVVAVLPTGYGKTVIFHLLPFVSTPHTQQPCILIANPLNAIITQQKTKFGDSCKVVDEEFLRELSGDLALGNIHLIESKLKDKKFLIGHPEQLTSSTFKKTLKSSSLCNRVRL